MGGRMADFFITDDRKGVLISHFARKYGADSAEFFVNACEREIVSWLESWPPTAPPSRTAVAQLERVRRLAADLNNAILGLDDRAAWILGRYRLAQREGATAQPEPSKVWEAIDDIADSTHQLAVAAGYCHEHEDAPLSRRSDQELCEQFVRLHRQAFGELPSSTPGSLFPAFCEDIANDVDAHPCAPSLKITRSVIRKAVVRFSASPLY